MMAQKVLSLEDVTLCYGRVVAVDALSLEVAGGEVFGLLGPNGCGKSTTLAAIAGALPPTAGAIRILGLEERCRPLDYRRLIGLVPQELAIFEELTAEENLSFFGRLYGLRGPDLKARVASALDFVRLTEQARRPSRTLSGGMQRRLNLACALLHEPRLLLLDEPTVGLDVASREAIFASLRTLRERGCALVFTTHHLEEAEGLCDRIGIMDRGRLLAVGTVAELLADLPERETQDRQGANVPRSYGIRDGSRTAVAEAPAVRRTPGLERIFLALTGRSLGEP